MDTVERGDRCLLCGGALEAFVERPRSSYAPDARWRIDRCASCGLGVTMPKPTAKELEDCYAGDYAYGAHQLIEAEKRRRARGLLDFASIEGGRVLDVGCMFGYLLDEARSRGAETWGVELAKMPAGVASSNGHRVLTGMIEDLRAKHPDERFDALFAQHVLEHLPEPESFLAAAHEMLGDRGKLVLAVPNVDARARSLAKRSWGWYQVPVHVYHYGETSLRRLLEKNGFRVVKTGKRGGDTLFMALTAMHGVGIVPKRGADKPPSGLLRGAFRVLGEATKPLTAALDDELRVVAERLSRASEDAVGLVQAVRGRTMRITLGCSSSIERTSSITRSTLVARAATFSMRSSGVPATTSLPLYTEKSGIE
jgi:SAM-dependent methyltransferase